MKDSQLAEMNFSELKVLERIGVGSAGEVSRAHSRFRLRESRGMGQIEPWEEGEGNGRPTPETITIDSEADTVLSHNRAGRGRRLVADGPQ